MYEIQEVLLEHHAFFPMYKQAHEILSLSCRGFEEKDLSVLLHYNGQMDRRRYNLPMSSEVAVILPGDGFSTTSYA